MVRGEDCVDGGNGAPKRREPTGDASAKGGVLRISPLFSIGSPKWVKNYWLSLLLLFPAFLCSYSSRQLPVTMRRMKRALIGNSSCKRTPPGFPFMQPLVGLTTAMNSGAYLLRAS